MREGEVLWIDPATKDRLGCPNGFPFRVMWFAGRADDNKFWVHGTVLEPVSGLPVAEDTIPVPLTQPRAVRRGNAIRAPRTDESEDLRPTCVPTDTVPAGRHATVAAAEVPAPYHVGRPVTEDTQLPGRPIGYPPPGYRRINVI